MTKEHRIAQVENSLITIESKALHFRADLIEQAEVLAAEVRRLRAVEEAARKMAKALEQIRIYTDVLEYSDWGDFESVDKIAEEAISLPAVASLLKETANNG